MKVRVIDYLFSETSQVSHATECVFVTKSYFDILTNTISSLERINFAQYFMIFSMGGDLSYSELEILYPKCFIKKIGGFYFLSNSYYIHKKLIDFCNNTDVNYYDLISLEFDLIGFLKNN